MGSKKWLSWIKGNDKEIVQLLEKQSLDLSLATNYLVELVTESLEKSISEDKVSLIKKLEHDADNTTHSLFTTLFQTFVTTLDREDIAGLASAIDQVLDYTEGIADRFLLFDMKNPTDHMLNLSQILNAAAKEIHSIAVILNQPKKVSELIPHCNNLKKYEQQADSIYRRAIADLFKTNDNAIEVIKFKEIYEIYESSLDKCQDVADIVENIVLKYG